MKVPDEGVLLRVFVGESDLHDGKPVYEHIVLRAHELGLSGATVLRGIMGYGATSRIHTARWLRLSEDLPVVVEIVDLENRIERLLPLLDDIVEEGLVTMERVQIIKYVHREQ